MPRYKPMEIPDHYFITTMYGGIVAGVITNTYCGTVPLTTVEWVQTDTQVMGDTTVTIPHVFKRRYDAAIACKVHDEQRQKALRTANEQIS